MTATPEPDGMSVRPGRDERSTIERIRHAALTSFAIHGTAATTLRAVAASAGVSLGLVQHHFDTKAGLIKAVDDYVFSVIVAVMAEPISEPVPDSITEVGNRVTEIVGQHPDVAGYVGRALVDGSPLGDTLFDRLMAVGMARWQQRADRGETRPDLDVTWAAINGLVLALGALSLRAHIDRHLPEPLTAPGQLLRWQISVDRLLRDGVVRRSVDE